MWSNKYFIYFIGNYKLPQGLLVEYQDNVSTSLVHNHRAAKHCHKLLVKFSHS